jgi:hypothetical protein
MNQITLNNCEIHIYSVVFTLDTGLKSEVSITETNDNITNTIGDK